MNFVYDADSEKVVEEKKKKSSKKKKTQEEIAEEEVNALRDLFGMDADESFLRKVQMAYASSRKVGGEKGFAIIDNVIQFLEDNFSMSYNQINEKMLRLFSKGKIDLQSGESHGRRSIITHNNKKMVYLLIK